MNVLLKPELAAFIARLQAGQYSDASDVVNEALEVMMEREQFMPEHLANLQHEVKQGIAELDRGEFATFDAETIIAEGRRHLHDRRANDDQFGLLSTNRL